MPATEIASTASPIPLTASAVTVLAWIDARQDDIENTVWGEFGGDALLLRHAVKFFRTAWDVQQHPRWDSTKGMTMRRSDGNPFDAMQDGIGEFRRVAHMVIAHGPEPMIVMGTASRTVAITIAEGDVEQAIECLRKDLIG